MGLSNWATKKDRFSTKRQTPNEEEVVNLIQNWRLKDKEVASDASDSELGFDKLERENSVPLKWDNIKTEEVVEIIKDYRSNKKTKYNQYQK
ncbi:hypothetical protein GLOIN_2v1771953 [Rhizophagus irregularis DAOM 181602=DAOM 197198]|uniref:Uncharacterized protein n=1 Tax=Rhizophagus irregularis (strain DAOM 197198w) TaxID=1432141 RepID=A0A015L5V4_RHIIW|nr:hypothetical protein RirG_273240 [Rhizophagus irregularis DAOM 197198w]GBC34140.1 hypothetical protein GLOIN_2v1771953 [Rhizophagus irregularis DAOM 181602=DAOM 197198]